MRYISLLLVVLIAGCSAKTHVRLSERHRLIAISKGAKIVPDTVHVTKTVTITVPAAEDTTIITPTIDSEVFDDTMGLNDSLVIEINDLQKDLLAGAVLDKERAMASLDKANRELRALRKRIAQGFSKDSVYVHKPDTLTTIFATVKDGLLVSIRYVRQEQVIKKEVSLPLLINQALEAGFQKWHLISIGAVMLIVGFVLGLLMRTSDDQK